MKRSCGSWRGRQCTGLGTDVGKVARKVHLIHRRPSFRAHALTVAELEQSTVEIHTPYLPQELSPEGLKLQRVKSDELNHLAVDKILVNYGMMTNHVDLNEELELSRRGRITANRQQETNISGLYVAEMPVITMEKPLMSVGFGEAVLAINDMTQKIKFSHSLQKDILQACLVNEEKIRYNG